MQRAGLAVVVAVVAGLSLGVSVSANAQSRMPANPFERLFRGQINPDLKTPRPFDQLPQPPKQAETMTIAPPFQNVPVCMPTVYGDTSIDPTFGHVPPTKGPMPLIRVVPVPPCRKPVR